MMPMYHWASRRIEAHVKICVLSLMIERVGKRSANRTPVLWAAAASG
jgi:transposase